MAQTENLDALPAAVARSAPSIVAIHARPRIPASGVQWRAGVVVAASHTIKRDQDITITCGTGQTRPATLVGRDPTTDLAVLKFEDAERVPVADLAGAETLAVGQPVLAVGRPGREATASFGIVSALGGPWRTWRGGA